MSRSRVTRVEGWSAFANDRGGAVAIIFAFTIIPVFLTVGLAIDGARGYSTKSKLGAVLDAAALATAKSMRDKDLDDDAVLEIAKKYVEIHMAPEMAKRVTAQPVLVAVDRAANTIKLDLTAHVANNFAGLVNIPQFEVRHSATAAFGAKEVELGMMLDVSGSMSDFGKIEDLKTAVTSLLEVMMPDGGGNAKVRIGIAPFSASVNAGDYASLVRAGPLANTCVSERKGPNAFTDAAPVSGDKLGHVPRMCPTSKVLAITDNKGDLQTATAALDPAGATAGHLGAAWAWYLVSPSWNGAVWSGSNAPKAYDNNSVIKSVLLMTDGMFNTQYELAANGTSAAQAIALCQNMKAKGILVYTVGFQAPPDALAILRQCATGPAYYFDATSAASLNAAFSRIAADLTELRLVR